MCCAFVEGDVIYITLREKNSILDECNLIIAVVCKNKKLYGPNKQTDAYGGSIENRARFTPEVKEVIVNTIGAERTAIRFTPWGTYWGKLFYYLLFHTAIFAVNPNSLLS